MPEHAPLALASGITPDNVHELKGLVTHVLVASSITLADGSELIDEDKLVALVERSAEAQFTEKV